MSREKQTVQPYQIEQYLESGVGVSIDAKEHQPYLIEQFLKAAQKGGATIVLRNAATLQPYQLNALGATAKGRLIIEL